MGNGKRNNLLIGCLCALGCEVFFGLSYVFTKHAMGEVSAFSLLGWRFLIAFIVMTGLIALRVVAIDLKGKSLRPLFKVALFSPCLYFVSETVGIHHTTASESGVFLACIPVVSLAASTWILKKKPSRLQVAGILIALVGVLMTVLAAGLSSSLSPIGHSSLVIAVVSYALYTISVDRASDFSGMEITYVMLTAGAVLFITFALAEAFANGTLSELATLPFYNPQFAIAVLYQGIGCSIAAFFLSNVAIARIGVNRTVSFIGVSTIVSVVAGTLILGETFTVWQAIGAAVIVAGVYIANAKATLS